MLKIIPNPNYDFITNDIIEKMIPKHKGDAGVDIYLSPSMDYIYPNKTLILAPHETKVIPLGFSIQFAPGNMAVIVDRSSIAKLGIHCSTSPIDQGYKGEIHLIIQNHSNKCYEHDISKAIAQLVLYKITTINSIECEGITITKRQKERNSGNFGSTNN